ncbi:MAG: hypothetical protein CVV64_04665 [Candidatus Wallbacteria bacterium HGW-Wallbacteria-1]|jgi:glycosyltransferase involved in cell wall biosynthesis|uniref:Glycosyltransferase n=1 Tax=Candidatus Wallbacteria bacterium HGW-Wallbacteria-1 TaxID=2013854 RepID=A0A2N1PRU4_9BACT|nr:MAG: hypothetical protein CVV64_04665 [Candidatus Wallbacteria bacterium HGW-Wallbacteria-1]
MDREIVYVINDLVGGGAEASLLDLAREMTRRGWNVSVLMILHRGVLLERAREWGVNLISLEKDGISGLRRLFASKNPLSETAGKSAEKTTRVIHGFLYWGNLLARILGLVSGSPVANSLRSTDLWRKSWHILLDRATLGCVDMYVPNSEAGRGRLLTVEKVPACKIRLIKNGLRSSMEICGAVNSPLASGEKRPVIGFAGRLADVKNPMLALSAFCIFLQRFPRALLRVAGDGPLRNEMMQAVERWGIEGNVQFQGHVQDMTAFMDSLDFFLLTSRWEGFPNVLLEAMARGKPIVTTDCGGASEIVINGVTGRIVSKDDSELLAREMITLMAEAHEYERMAENCRQRILKFFTFKTMADFYENLYNELVEASH